MTKEEYAAWKEHLDGCKERAEAYLARGDWQSAWISFISDLKKHDHGSEHPGLLLGTQLFFNGHLSSVAEMRKFIQGFN